MYLSFGGYTCSAGFLVPPQPVNSSTPGLFQPLFVPCVHGTSAGTSSAGFPTTPTSACSRRRRKRQEFAVKLLEPQHCAIRGGTCRVKIIDLAPRAGRGGGGWGVGGGVREGGGWVGVVQIEAHCRGAYPRRELVPLW